ncbi:MAG TPA: nucleotide exchange factor GrpE [Candidatus Paceibacterota bacterium]|nr:nucleotide exchange factor GrpE [Candidatus Paceibacterota bacterium]
MDEHEKYLRLAADFDNYRKRMEGELGEVTKFGIRLVVTDMLDVLDHLEQAIAHAPPDTPAEWLKGLKQVQRQFEAAIQKTGAKRIDSQGKKFDPNTMEAVHMVEGGPSHQVKEEVRAGFTLHDRVIRPARVIIYQ